MTNEVPNKLPDVVGQPKESPYKNIDGIKILSELPELRPFIKLQDDNRLQQGDKAVITALQTNELTGANRENLNQAILSGKISWQFMHLVQVEGLLIKSPSTELYPLNFEGAQRRASLAVNALLVELDKRTKDKIRDIIVPPSINDHSEKKFSTSEALTKDLSAAVLEQANKLIPTRRK
jgi:hypothetical protein